jgi:hypothetical protein
LKSLPPEVERRRRIVTRAVPLTVIALIAFVAGIMVGSSPPAERQAAEDFVSDWARQDFGAMHAELNAASQARYTAADLRNAYSDAQQKATVRTIDPEDAEGPETVAGVKVVTVPVRLGTVAFGNFDSQLRLPFTGGGIAWDPHLAFPGLHQGEQLSDAIELGPRGAIVAGNGEVLARGSAEAREHPLGSDSIDITGLVGQAPASDLAELSRQGFPAGTPVGISGLERAFNRRLAGKPGGQLIATTPGGACRPGRRRRRARRPQRGRAGAGGDRLLRTGAPRLDFQGRDHDGGASEGDRLPR